MKPAFLSVRITDYAHIRDIYNHYVDNTTVTFETRRHTLNDVRKDYPLAKSHYLTYMIRIEEKIAGFCFLKPYKSREAYNRTAMIGIYLKPGYERRGIGRSAVEFLEERALESKIKVILGYITAENVASVRLVEKLGYIKCGHFRNIGEKFGKVLDVVFYQKEILK